MRSARESPERPLPAGYGGAIDLETRIEALLRAGGRTETLGRSVEGRELRAHVWGPAVPGPAAEAARRVLLLSLLHPMEWIGLEVHLSLLEAWLHRRRMSSAGNAAGSPAASEAFAGSEPFGLPPGTAVASIPMANPDGFARVEEALRTGRPRWVRGNAARVDLNRNFPVGHRRRPRALGAWPLYRPGPSPLSEPETAAIAAFARRFRPAIAISLHSYGRRVFVPPARRRRPLAGTPEMLACARRAIGSGRYRAAVLGSWSPLFRAAGTEIDFLHEEVGARAYLVEVSSGGFARWGWRRALVPFCLFNPPEPAREIALVLPMLHRLIAG
jgi:hypothetical protein